MEISHLCTWQYVLRLQIVPGLDQNANYVVKAVFPAGKPRYMLISPPEWMNGITMSGSALATIGVTAPILAPANAFLIEIKKA